MLGIITVSDTGEFLSQRNGFAVEVQNRIRIFFLRSHIDLLVVFVYIEPGLAGGEACVFLRTPLHGRSGRVTGTVPQAL